MGLSFFFGTAILWLLYELMPRLAGQPVVAVIIIAVGGIGFVMVSLAIRLWRLTQRR